MSAGNASLSGSPTTQQHYHAFLSHNGADKPSVEQLGEELEKRGLYCWLDNWNLVPGDPWQPAIEEALGQCDSCVVFFGPHGLGPWHNEEMRLAIRRHVNAHERQFRVLPVILPRGQRAKESDLPGFLQGTTWVEFRQSINDETALHRLVCGIKGIPPGRGPRATIQTGECPYLGLKTFQPEDAPLFFGRDAKVQELLDRLRNNFGTPSEERFLALIGASGSGKSSIALAGLIPAVRRGELPESAKWTLVRCRPGARPWENLQIALSNNQEIALRIAALPALITRPEDEQRRLHLAAQLVLHDQPETNRLFILIDQFEEIFTLCNDEAERCQLIDNVLYATNVADGQTIVVPTMRADFYGQCTNYPGLRAAIADHQSLIGPLRVEELRDAIQSPAQLAGGELEPGLIELLLADMEGQAGALPFLEHALFKLWERRDGRHLTAKAYMVTGRLQGALDAHAEEFFTKALTTEEQSLCRQVLVDLVHPGEGTADTKKRVSLDDVAPTPAARAVLKKLVDARLVTTDREDRPEASQAELAHEALISGWRRLGEWVNENREKSRLKERLLDAAREWQKNGKREDFLYRGVQLAAAEESFGWKGEPLPKLGEEFLEASIVEECRERNERQLQQDRELASLATVAQTERQRAELESKARRRQRYYIIALVGLLLLVGLVAIVAMQQGISARRAENNAQAAAQRITEVAGQANQAASQANVSLARYSQEAGNDAEALAHLVQALRLNQRNYEAVTLTGAMLTQTNWPLSVTALIGHDSVINSAQFSPDGRLVVTASSDRTARLWDVASGKPIGKPMKHGGSVYSARFSPDGRLVVTASSDGTARLWDVASGEPIGETMEHEDLDLSRVHRQQIDAPNYDLYELYNEDGLVIDKFTVQGLVNSAQFSPDGRRVVTASKNRTARLWEVPSGKPIGEVMKHADSVRSAQFSPDGQRVVTASSDETAQLWDATSGKPIGEPMKHTGWVYSAQFSPDGQRVVTASSDETARLWDAISGKPIGEPMKHRDWVNSAQFSPDGQRVVTASSDGTAQLWDAASGKPVGEPMRHTGSVRSAWFSPDGQRVVTACSDGMAQLWDAASGKPIGEPMKHTGSVRSAWFSPDGQRVVTAYSDGTAQLWNALTSKPIDEPMKHRGWVNSARFSPDGQRVVTASSDETAQLWDAISGKPIGVPMKHKGWVYSAQFSPDGQRVVTASSDETAQLWDAISGKPIGEPMKHKGWVNSAQFSPDGQRVVSASSDTTARLWEAASGRPIGQPMVHEDAVSSAQFSPNGQLVVSSSSDGTARLWDAATGKALSEPMKHTGSVRSAQFSPDGQSIVTSSSDGTVQLWNAASGKPIGEPMKHGGVLSSAQFSPNGQRVVSTSSNGTAQLWDTASGKPIGQPMEHGGVVSSAQFSSDGRRVVTSSWDKTARLWDALTGKPIGEAMKQEDAVSSAQFSPDGQRVVTASRDRTVRLWDVPTISSDDSAEHVLLLAELAEASSGVAVQTSEQAEILNVLTPEQVSARLNKIAAEFSTPLAKSTPLQRFLKWSVSERRSRTISPFSGLTVPEWIENRIKESTPDGLRAAILVDPPNARLAAHFGLALANLAVAEKTDPAEARRMRAEADFQTHRALKLDPDNDEVRKLRDGIIKLLNLPSDRKTN